MHEKKSVEEKTLMYDLIHIIWGRGGVRANKKYSFYTYLPAGTLATAFIIFMLSVIAMLVHHSSSG